MLCDIYSMDKCGRKYGKRMSSSQTIPRDRAYSRCVVATRLLHHPLICAAKYIGSISVGAHSCLYGAGGCALTWVVQSTDRTNTVRTTRSTVHCATDAVDGSEYPVKMANSGEHGCDTTFS
ncbi:uncharacterized protein BO97DRAFT_93525 [Aspergillus homomorphus CBS 101889]|uniref:Uncharacterized protein n=1 Tax=Aspergillus homomorphus (strain CBS 101889) TaxID=1450537 RepID=A0A395HV73_ASPHC|nr:hypothetical protein BO97DRAFT_93525 [Aspergillus homomorphus CBS 101889]RAL11707.1 hypothetical protein BO97DRAFT_93525 [Aspergillus homomorphus CBS 101889]